MESDGSDVDPESFITATILCTFHILHYILKEYI